jgi:tetratricopeptide (TPR) repeat protein
MAMNMGFDTGYAILNDTFRILGGMHAPWVVIGTASGVVVVIGIALGHIVHRKSGAGILFPIKAGMGHQKKTRIRLPRTGDDWCARGEELVATGMYREALCAYVRAYAMKKDRPAVLYRRGRILFDMGMYDQAWGQVSHAFAEDSCLAPPGY